MPRFFFHVRYANHAVVRDLQGIEFPDLVAAIIDAQIGIAETIEEKETAGEPVEMTAIEVCDESGKLLGTIPFSR